MKLLKRSIALILSIVMLLSVSITIRGAGHTPQHTEEAKILYKLGLFKGIGSNADGTPIFSLEQKATRIQGLVMLIRLLGKEAEALAYTGKCPFTDVPDWAERYAAYAYDNGITNGTGGNTFSSDAPLLGKAYVTFVLRALGYDDAAGDFSYNEALMKGEELGLVSAGECTGDIYRDDCAVISYNALKTAMKNTDTKLMDKLVTDGVLTDSLIQTSGILYGKVSIPVTVTANNGKYTFDLLGKDFLDVIPTAAYIDNTGWGGTTADMFKKMIISPIGVVLGSGDYADFQEGHRPSRPVLTPTRTMSFERGNGLVILSVFDNDFNLLAYCTLAPGRSYEGVTELVFTTCNYNGKDDMKRIENVIRNVKELSADAIYVEKTVTVQEDGTESVEQYLRIKENKWPAGIGTAAYYSVTGGRDKASMLRSYANFWRDLQTFGVDQQYGTEYKAKDYLYIYNEARDIVAFVNLPQKLTIIETTIEE